jgi:pimeloyl-ACP methyl ester carboxylesterase
MKPPLLFIHGAFTRAKRWDPWLAFFRAQGFTCFAPSLPAHDPPDMAALEDLTFDDYVAAMVAAHASLGEPPVIIGSSMGGLVAQHVSARTRSVGLVLISSAAPWIGGGRIGALPAALQYLWPVFTGHAMRGDKDAARKLVLHDLSPEEQDFFLSIFADESGKAYRAMVTGGAPVTKGAVRCPVLCLSASEDRLFKPSLAEKLAAFYGARHHIFPGGHTLASGALLPVIGDTIARWIEDIALPSFQAAQIV